MGLPKTNPDLLVSVKAEILKNISSTLSKEDTCPYETTEHIMSKE